MITFPAVLPGPPVVVSATQYVTYRTCPEQARVRSTGRYGPDTRQALRGMLAHRLFYRHLVHGEMAPHQVEAVCLAEIGERYNDRLPSLGLAKMSALRPLLREVRDLYCEFAKVDMGGVREAEIDIAHQPSEEVTLRGTVDAVFGDRAGVRLMDWKTGSLGEAEHQLDFYALLWTLDRGELPHTVEAASVSSGDRYVAHPTADRLQSVAGAVGRIVSHLRRASLRETSLERTAGPHCAWCPALAECNEGAAAISLTG